MRRLIRSLVALIVIGAPALLPAQRDTVLTVASYLDLETVSDPQLSPDGKQIIYTRRYVNTREDRWDTALWIMDADGGGSAISHSEVGRAGPPMARGSSISPRGSRRGRSSSCGGWTPKGRRVR